MREYKIIEVGSAPIGKSKLKSKFSDFDPELLEKFPISNEENASKIIAKALRNGFLGLDPVSFPDNVIVGVTERILNAKGLGGINSLKTNLLDGAKGDSYIGLTDNVFDACIVVNYECAMVIFLYFEND